MPNLTEILSSHSRLFPSEPTLDLLAAAIQAKLKKHSEAFIEAQINTLSLTSLRALESEIAAHRRKLEANGTIPLGDGVRVETIHAGGEDVDEGSRDGDSRLEVGPGDGPGGVLSPPLVPRRRGRPRKL